MTTIVIDLLLVIVLLSYAAIGYRRGLVMTAFSAAGFLAGAGVALWLLPGLIATALAGATGTLANPVVAPVLLIIGILVLGSIGQSLLSRLGRPLRRGLARGGAGPLDDLFGAALTLVVAVAIVWFAAGILRASAPDSVAGFVARSQVLTAIDRVMPGQSDRVVGRVLVTLDQYGVPRAFSGLTAEPITPVDSADSEVASTRGVAAAQASILRIDALAMECGRSQEGTGWVVGDDLVVTNAHVVAGAEQVTLTVAGRRVIGQVVAFDPDRDLAVLSARLPVSAAPLRLAGELSHGDSAVVAGYPGGGPYRVQAARVRGAVTARGDDIYGTSGVTRELYALRAQVRPGNSGGPLLTPDGAVAGVIFARSLDDSATAYALTLDELRPVLAQARSGDGAVGTGRCAA